MHPDEVQRIRDEEHVKLLSIFYYVSGGISALFGLFPLLYVAMGVMVMALPDTNVREDQIAARFMGVIFVGFGLVFFLFLQTFAGLKLLAGYWLTRRMNRTACLVIGGIICIGFPFSTALGVFTLLVLQRESVRELFAAAPGSAPPGFGGPA